MLFKTFLIVSSAFIIAIASTSPASAGVCGDINNDGNGPDVSDLTYFVDYLFRGGDAPPQLHLTDVNGDGNPTPNVADLTYLVDYLFRGGPAPACPYILPSTTAIIPADDTTEIQGYDTTSGAITMKESSEYAQQVEVGDILLGQDDVDAPNGFLRKVTAKTTQGGSIVIETGPATMMEAFEEMDISETHPLSPADVKSVKLYNGATFAPGRDGRSFDVTLNCILYDLDGNPGTIGDQIRLEGTYAFTADLFADIKIRWFSLKKFEAGIETNENVNVDLIASMQWEFNEAVSFDLAEFQLGAIPIGGAVWLVPTLSVEAHIHGDLTVTFETGISYTQELRYGFGWADDAFYQISEGTKNFTYMPPQFSAQFNFEPGVSLNTACLIYGVAGPYVAGKTGIHFESTLDIATCDVELSFDLEALLYAVAGIECDILNLNYSHQWQLYTHQVGQWGVPFPGPASIIVNSQPDAINAPWTMAGPCDYDASGSGDETLENLSPGDYTITWGVVPDWIAPAGATVTVGAYEEVILSGVYIEEPPTGTIVVNASPDEINAPWSLTGPDGYSSSGSGDATLPDMDLGEYTLTWGEVTGWIAPLSSTQVLSEDQTVTFGGMYVQGGDSDSTGTVTDIDGNVYRTVKIGNQWWMMENLKVTHYRNGYPIPNVTSSSTWDTLTSGAYCEYDNNPYYVETYGLLYNWHALVDSRKIAPPGWHVPTDEEWKQLEMYLGMSQADADTTGPRGTDEGGKLKEVGTEHWIPPNEGATNESGFTALPGGHRVFFGWGGFGQVGYYAFFWSSTNVSTYGAIGRCLWRYTSKIDRYNSDKREGMSVRCVRDSVVPTFGTLVIDPSPDAINAPWTLYGPEGYSNSGNGNATLQALDPGHYILTWEATGGWMPPPPDTTRFLLAGDSIVLRGAYAGEGGPDSTGTVSDIDGNAYQTIKIGDQWWTMENLKVTRYRNGDSIANITFSSNWDVNIGAYCEYENDSSYGDVYGRLYNWHAVDDSRGIAPAGWHVATDEDWQQLEVFLGMHEAVADSVGRRGTEQGGKLKEEGTTHWLSPNEGATNESGFTALPGGIRWEWGNFMWLGHQGLFWSSTGTGDSDAWQRWLSTAYSDVYRRSGNKREGLSVRCVRD